MKSDEPSFETIDSTKKNLQVHTLFRHYQQSLEISDFLQMLVQSSESLQVLTLSNNSYSFPVFYLIVQGASSCQNLCTLQLRKCFGPGSLNIRLLPELFSSLSDLRQLDLSNNNLSSIDMMKLGWGLNRLRYLVLLNLDDNHIGVQGSVTLAQSLNTSKARLQFFSVKNNQIRNQGATQICKPLENLKTLRSLALSENGIGRTGILGVCRVLGRNLQLESLELQDNYLNELWSAKALKTSLIKLKNLKILNLADCELGNDGALEIIKALNRMKIRELYLQQNEIYREDVTDILCKYIRKRIKYLKYVCLYGNDLEVEKINSLIKNFSSQKKCVIDLLSYQDHSEDEDFRGLFKTEEFNFTYGYV